MAATRPPAAGAKAASSLAGVSAGGVRKAAPPKKRVRVVHNKSQRRKQLQHLDMNVGFANTPAKKTLSRLNTLAALTSTPVRSRVLEDPNTITPMKLDGGPSAAAAAAAGASAAEEFSPVSKGFPAQCRRPRTAPGASAEQSGRGAGAHVGAHAASSRAAVGPRTSSTRGELESIGFELLLRASSQATPSKASGMQVASPAPFMNWGWPQPLAAAVGAFSSVMPPHFPLNPAALHPMLGSLAAAAPAASAPGLSAAAAPDATSDGGAGAGADGAASRWFDLLAQDIKGRLAALKRSKSRAQKVREKINLQCQASTRVLVTVERMFTDFDKTLAAEQGALETWQREIVQFRSLHRGEGGLWGAFARAGHALDRTGDVDEGGQPAMPQQPAMS